MSVMGPGRLDYQHGRHADLPWPVVHPRKWLDADEMGWWALRAIERIGAEVPPRLRGPVAQVIAYVYEYGYGDG